MPPRPRTVARAVSPRPGSPSVAHRTVNEDCVVRNGSNPHPTARLLACLIAAAILGVVGNRAQGQCPPPPVLSGDGDCGEVTLNWTPVPNALGYTLRRGTAPSFSLAGVLAQLDAAETQFVDEVGVAGTQYWYWITATVPSGGGCSGTTAASAFHTEMWQGFPSPAPSLINSSTSSCQIVIEWSIAPGASFYRVYRSPTTSFAQAQVVDETDLFPRVLTDPDIPFGQSATYWVRGVSDCGEGPLSAPLTVTRSYTFPNSPTNFTATALCLGGVRLTWNPPANTPVTSYNVQWSRSDLGNFSSIDLDGDITSFDPPGLIPGTDYVFFITASNPCGLSQSVSVPLEAPEPQAGGTPTVAPALISNTSNGCAAALSWNRVPDATAYRVYRSATNLFAQAQQVSIQSDPGEGDSVTLADTSAPIGVTRWYWVRPFNPCAEGPLSNSATAVRTAGPPTPVVSVSATTPCDGRIKLTWTQAPPAPGAAATGVRVVWFSPEDPQGGESVVDDAGSLGSLVIDGLVPGSAYTFEIAARNACGEAAAVEAEAVITAPLPPTQATGSAADLGGVLTAEVPAGLNQVYQWFKDDEPVANGPRISGATSRLLRIEPAQWSDAGVYDVRISAAVGSDCAPVMSTAAILAVRPSCDGDIDGSGAVDLADLIGFLNQWLPRVGANCP